MSNSQTGGYLLYQLPILTLTNPWYEHVTHISGCISTYITAKNIKRKKKRLLVIGMYISLQKKNLNSKRTKQTTQLQNGQKTWTGILPKTEMASESMKKKKCSAP